MRVILIGLVCLILTVQTVFGQEKWVPQKQVTGYIAMQGEYFSDLEGFDKSYGALLNEAGLLMSYKPIPKLTFKSVMVYRPELTIDLIINELNFEYEAKDYLQIKVGRFLTPLSTMNTYYYAPVNTSITLPMIISHHEIFPSNVDGLSVNGVVGNDLKLSYDLFAGGFHHRMWTQTGVIGFLGLEQNFFKKITNDYFNFDTNTTNSILNFCEGAHVDFSYQDMAMIGFNIFNVGDNHICMSIPSMNYQTGAPILDDQNNPVLVSYDASAKSVTYGLNFKFEYAGFKILSELWRNKIKVDSEMNIDGAFVEVSKNFNKLTPYARYEFSDVVKMKYTRQTIGLNFKPIFETTFKIEYVHYDYDPSEDQSYNVDGLIGSIIYSF